MAGARLEHMTKPIRDTWLIVAADGFRARFFTLEAPELPLLEGGPDLVEHQVLLNPEQRLEPKERFANLKSGRNRAPGGGPAHGYDDHRANHVDEDESRFARRLADAVMQFADRIRPRHLVLAADPRLLGMLRSELGNGAAPDMRELTKDVSGVSRPELHEQLARAGLVPAREPPPERPARRL